MTKLKEIFEEVEMELYEEETGSDGIEQDYLEANESLRESDQYEELSAKLEDISTGLEEAIAYIEEQDSLSASEASVIADPLLPQLGEDEELAASLEAASDGQEVRSIALEGFVDTVKKVTKAIVNAVLRAIRAIRDFFARIFGGFKKIEKQARKLRSALGKVDFGKTPEPITIRNPASLVFRGEVTAEGIETGAQNLIQLNEDLSGPWLQTLELYYKAVSEVVDMSTRVVEHGDDGSSLERLKEKLMSFHDQELIAASSRVYTTTVLGDKQFYPDHEAQKKLDKGANADRRIARFKIITMPTPPKLKNVEGADPFKESTVEITPLKRDALTKILDGIITICGLAAKRAGGIKKVNSARESTLSSIEKFAQRTSVKSHGHSEGDAHRIGNMAKISWRFQLRAIQKNMLSPINELTAHNFRSCRRLLELAARSIKAYEGGTYKIDVPDANIAALPAPATV